MKLGWLPTVGRQDVLISADHPTNFYILDGILTGNPEAAWDAAKHLILPAIALGSIPLAIIARITRAAVLDVQNEDYVRTARAKGMSSRVVDGRHIFRNAMLPVVTVIGLQTGLLLSGRSSRKPSSRSPVLGRGSRGQSTLGTTPCCKGGSSSSPPSSSSSTCSSTSRTASSTRG